jgi:hypothetical protein
MSQKHTNTGECSHLTVGVNENQLNEYCIDKSRHNIGTGTINTVSGTIKNGENDLSRLLAVSTNRYLVLQTLLTEF